MICFDCQSKPCVCQSQHWNHWVESDTVEKFDAFVKSLQKNPGLVQQEQIDHYIAQLQELRRNPAHVVTSISVDSLGGLGHGIPFQIGQGRLERTRERREFGGRGYLVYGPRVVPDHQEPIYPHHRQMMNPNRWAGKCSPFPLLDAKRYSTPEWDAMLLRLARQPGVSRLLGILEPQPRTLEEMPHTLLAKAIHHIIENKGVLFASFRTNPLSMEPVKDYIPLSTTPINYLEQYRRVANVRSNRPEYGLDNVMRADFNGEPRVSVDFELCDEVGLPIEPAERERRAGVVVLSQKARQANIALQYQVLGGRFPREGLPLLHSGLVVDEQNIYPNELTGKSNLGMRAVMDGIRNKRKKQHNRNFWVDRQQPAWAGGRKKGKR